MKTLLCLFAAMFAVVGAAWGDGAGLWGGKWDDLWPVFIQVEPGNDPGTYNLTYLWVENMGSKNFSRSASVARKKGDYFDAGMLLFKLDEATGTGLLYGKFDKPRMANLVKLGADLPAAPESDAALKKNGWKTGALAAPEAYQKITGNYPANMPNVGEDAKNKAIDKDHLLQIWKAIMAYKKAKGQVPDYLSDLVPEYLPDQSVLTSPCANWGLRRRWDPKLPLAYSYEFRGDAMGPGGVTFRAGKEEQMKKYGEAVPILRCFAHEKVMNVAYSGDYYESDLYWEQSAGARELAKRLDSERSQ